MVGEKLLHNNGIDYIGEKDILDLKQKTLIVLGVGRGGTSLISGSLAHLGIFMGEEAYPPVFEDVKLATQLENKKFEDAKSTIESYNSNDIWGFKRPSSIEYVKELHNSCKNPIYLIIFKDIFAISNRNTISMKFNLLDSLKSAHTSYGKILSFLSNENPNAFLFSYEKMMQDKELFVDTLIELIGTKRVTPQQKKAALNFIEPNPKGYLDTSRITKSIGKIGNIRKTRITGWGKYLNIDEPATVELYINKQFIKSYIAKDFRPHLLKSKKHPTGHCGFSFDISDSPLKDGDIISVKIEDDVVFLAGSDIKYAKNKI